MHWPNLLSEIAIFFKEEARKIRGLGNFFLSEQVVSMRDLSELGEIGITFQING